MAKKKKKVARKVAKKKYRVSKPKTKGGTTDTGPKGMQRR